MCFACASLPPSGGSTRKTILACSGSHDSTPEGDIVYAESEKPEIDFGKRFIMISNGQASLLDVFVCNGSRCCAGSASRDPRQVGCGTGAADVCNFVLGNERRQQDHRNGDSIHSALPRLGRLLRGRSLRKPKGSYSRAVPEGELRAGYN